MRRGPAALGWASRVVALALVACPAVAGAQGGQASGAEAAAVEAAREHFRRGVAYYADGDLSAALVELQRAYALQPSYRLLYNLGQVSAELLDYVTAERYFVRYLEQGGDEIEPERQREVKAELVGLRSRIGTITVAADQTGAQVFVDDTVVGVTPVEGLKVSAGQRRIRVQMPGFDPVTHVVHVLGGQRRIVRFRLSKIPVRASASPPGVSASERSGSVYGRVALWTGVATGVLALGTAGAAYAAHVSNQDYADELDRPTSRAELDRLADRTRTRALVADALLGTTLATAVATTVLLLLDDGEGPPPRAAGGRFTFHGTQLRF